MFNILSQQLYHLIIDYFWEDYTAETMALVRLSPRASGTFLLSSNHRRQIEARPRDLTSEAHTLSTKTTADRFCPLLCFCSHCKYQIMLHCLTQCMRFYMLITCPYEILRCRRRADGANRRSTKRDAGCLPSLCSSASLPRLFRPRPRTSQESPRRPVFSCSNPPIATIICTHFKTCHCLHRKP